MRKTVAVISIGGALMLSNEAVSAVTPVDPDTRAVAELQFSAWLTQQGIEFGPISVACGIGEVGGSFIGLCYANNEESGVIGIGAASTDGVVWSFVDLEDAAPPAAAGPAGTIGDGTWIVGTDVAPGAYRAPGGDLCYWARLADFSGEDIIANEFSDTNSQVLVEIAASDVAFETTGCGTWEPLG